MKIDLTYFLLGCVGAGIACYSVWCGVLWLLGRTSGGQRQCMWESCVWKEDVELSTAGLAAVLAGMWWPPTTCTKCGSTKEPQNFQYADENGWLRKKRETPKGSE